MPNTGNSSHGGGGRSFNSIYKDLKSDIDKNNNINQLKYFNPFRFNQKEDPLIKGLPVIFITTPSLYLNETNLKSRGFFRYLRDCEPELISLLNFGGTTDGSILGTGSPFIKILTNQFENISFNGVTMRTKEMNETFYGFKQLFPTSMIDSITANTISIEYSEDKNLNIIKLHKAWTDYIEYARRGIIRPSEKTKVGRFIDFSCSIYYFLLDFDFQTILYYSKYTGCSPISVPYDALATAASGGRDIVRVNIDYAYGYKEDMNPDILYDFNIVASSASKLTETDDVDRVMYQSESKLDLNYSKDFFDQDFSNISNVGITLENYGDNKEKKRFKLKFFSNPLPTSNSSNLADETMSEVLSDKNSDSYKKAKELLKKFGKNLAISNLTSFNNSTKGNVASNTLSTLSKLNPIGNAISNTLNKVSQEKEEEAKINLNNIANEFAQLTGTYLNSQNYADISKKFK